MTTTMQTEKLYRDQDMRSNHNSKIKKEALGIGIEMPFRVILILYLEFRSTTTIEHCVLNSTEEL
jgi:hypothetical protein